MRSILHEDTASHAVNADMSAYLSDEGLFDVVHGGGLIRARPEDRLLALLALQLDGRQGQELHVAHAFFRALRECACA